MLSAKVVKNLIHSHVSKYSLIRMSKADILSAVVKSFVNFSFISPRLRRFPIPLRRRISESRFRSGACLWSS